MKKNMTTALAYLIPMDIVKTIKEHLHDLLYLRKSELDVCIAKKSR